MTLLIQDARRPLLSGIVDDGSLVSASPRSVEQSVDRFRSLRESRTGWMVGSFVTPVRSLETLAAALVQTMHGGEVPWPVTVAADGPSSASVAAAFHAAMDPAATVTAAWIPRPMETPTDIERALAVARGMQPETLPLLTIDASEDVRRSVRMVALAGERTLQPAGVIVDTAPGVSAAALAETVHACMDERVPLVVVMESAPPVTTIDEDTGTVRYGILNLLALSSEWPDADAEALLLSRDGRAFTVDFGGMSSPAGRVRSTVGRPPTRGPLRSIVTTDPSLTISSLAAHVAEE